MHFGGRGCMAAGSLRFLLGVGTAVIGTIAAAPSGAQTRACQPTQTMREGWNASFVAGCFDRNGRFAGGSQVMHLVPHKGVLYAASGYWKDKRNVWYGGKDPSIGWGQVLRLSGPDAPWTVDFELGPQHLRAELLKSITFTLDGNGRPLPSSRYAADCGDVWRKRKPRHRLFCARRRTRHLDHEQGHKWRHGPARRGQFGSRRRRPSRSHYRPGKRLSRRRRPGHLHRPLRSFAARQDRLGIGARTGHGDGGTRILSIVEANDSLFFSEGTKVFRRIDGPAPRWVEIADLSGEASADTDRALFQSIGGIRGLSAIDGPVPGRQSLIFMWHPGKRSSRGCVVRLDPQPDGAYARVAEACLAQQIGKHIGGAPIGYVAGAYNNFMPLRDPKSGELLHIVGLEAFISATPEGRRFEPLTAHNMRSDKGGFYAGGMYSLRDARGRWRIGEVNGKYGPGQPELVSIYTVAVSPFGEPRPPDGLSRRL